MPGHELPGMETIRLREDGVEAFVDELWVPAQRELATGQRYSLRDEIREPGVSFVRSRVTDEDAVVFLATGEGGPVGYVIAEVQTPPPMVEPVRECHVTELFVAPDARRQGVATALLAETEAWAVETDCAFLKLMVSADNRAALDLYEASAYTVSRHGMYKPVGASEE